MPGFSFAASTESRVFANESYERLFPGRAVIDASARETFADVADQGFLDILDRVYATGERFVGSRMRMQLDASAGMPARELYLDFVYEPIQDAAGRTTGIFVEGFDVSEHVRAENDLRASEARCCDRGWS